MTFRDFLQQDRESWSLFLKALAGFAGAVAAYWALGGWKIGLIALLIAIAVIVYVIHDID